jgi:hypothetical protein
MQALLAVCRIWKMPPHMVQELGRATWGNLASEMVSFEKFTIQPWLRRIEGAIERDIIGDDDDLYAEFLVEGLLRSDITTRYQAYEIAVRNGWMRPEEVRQKENLGPMPEGVEPQGPAAPAAEPPALEPEDEPDTEDATEGEGRFDPNQPRGPDGKWGEGGGASGGDSGGSDSGGGGAGDSGDAGGAEGSQSQSTQRKERLRDRIEGTQAEADREVVKADRKVQQIKQKIAAVKAEAAGSKVAEAKAKVAAAEQSLGQVQSRVAELKSQAAASKARMAELKARLKQRAEDELEAALEREASTAEGILDAMTKVNKEADKILASLE